MSEFDDETPLPPAPPLVSDPLFPTGQIPRIALSDLDLADDSDDAGALYPRWLIRSPCSSLDEFARLYAPHFATGSLLLFSADVRPVGTRAAIELHLRAGGKALAGIAEVTESFTAASAPHGHPGMRLQLLSVDPISAPLLAALGEHASGSPLPRGITDAEPLPAASGDATTEMSKFELADLLGDDAEGGAWSDLLLCRIEESSVTAAELAAPPPPRPAAGFAAPLPAPLRKRGGEMSPQLIAIIAIGLLAASIALLLLLL